jgi:hypothetical protein
MHPFLRTISTKNDYLGPESTKKKGFIFQRSDSIHPSSSQIFSFRSNRNWTNQTIWEGPKWNPKKSKKKLFWTVGNQSPKHKQKFPFPERIGQTLISLWRNSAWKISLQARNPIFSSFHSQMTLKKNHNSSFKTEEEKRLVNFWKSPTKSTTVSTLKTKFWRVKKHYWPL